MPHGRQKIPGFYELLSRTGNSDRGLIANKVLGADHEDLGKQGDKYGS